MSRIKKLPEIELITNEETYAKALSECATKCSSFAEKFLDLNVFDYNKVFLDCNDRFIVYRTGRQVGKSRNAAIKAIHFGYFAPLFAQNLDEGEANVVVASVSKDQASLIFHKISNFIHKSPTLAKCVVRETKTELTLEWFDGSGRTNFIVRPIGDTGESLRGFTVHMAILDEAAFIPQVVYDAFLPSTVTTRPKILLTSTPKGKSGAFFNACEHSYRIFRKGKEKILHTRSNKYKWTQFHVTTFDNPLAASDPEVLDLIRGTSKAAERQELYGEFLDGGNSIVPYNLLQEAVIEYDERPKFEYYECGVDTSGKGQDETVIIVIGVTPDGRIFPVDCYSELTTDQVQLANKIHEMNASYRFRRIYFDETGMGDTLGDIIRDKYPELPIYGVNFKTEKTDLYVNLERLFEEHSVIKDRRIINLTLLQGVHHDNLIEQIAYMYWEHGKYKDQAPKARSENHDDYPDGLALACYGQRKGNLLEDIPDFWETNYGVDETIDEHTW